MARLYLFAEGQTEQTFAGNLLMPNLALHGVFLHNPVLIAHGKNKGKVHRGGVDHYLPMRNDILRFLAQEKDTDVFFTTMIDLYGIQSDFPGLAEADKLCHLPEKRVEFLEQQFAQDIGDTRFIPYLQLHEYEACLFAYPAAFELFYPQHTNEIAALQAVADSYATPELINDGQHSAPSKRIIAHLPGYKRAKTVVGPQIADLIGLETIRSKCPHFSRWLTRLEQLGAVMP